MLLLVHRKVYMFIDAYNLKFLAHADDTIFLQTFRDPPVDSIAPAILQTQL